MIESIGATEASGTAQQTLGQEDLFKIMLTQLSYQDPLKPMDNQEFIAQLAQFTALEQTRQLNEKIDNLLRSQSADQAINLIGRNIQVGLEQATETGVVVAVAFDAGTPRFTVQTPDDRFIADISLAQVQVVN